MTKLTYPFTEEKVRPLKVGDEFLFPASCSPGATRLYAARILG
jgi:hypothetical protein